jgi:glycosyltransferase involved in cell wall biosynthesis
VDDGSSDNSASIVKSFCEKDKRITYFLQQNGGPSRARNKGFELSKGDYIQFLDSDDVITTDRLKHMLFSYSNIKDNDVVLYSDLLVGENGNILKTTKFSFATTLGYDIDFRILYKEFAKQVLFVPGCVLFPRKSLMNCAWDETISQAEDFDLYLQVAQKNGFVFRFLPEILLYYRNTPNSLSTNLRKIYLSNYEILERYRTVRNLIHYCNKAGFMLYRNLINLRKKKIAVLVSPITFANKKSITSFCLLPITLLYCVFNFIPSKK